MSKQLEVNHQSLLDAYYEYYTAKLTSREHFENINKIDNEQYDYEHFEINKEAEQHLKDSYEPIKNLLFLFRGNYDYIVSLVSILDEKIMNDSIKNNYCLKNNMKIIRLPYTLSFDDIQNIIMNEIKILENPVTTTAV